MQKFTNYIDSYLPIARSNNPGVANILIQTLNWESRNASIRRCFSQYARYTAAPISQPSPKIAGGHTTVNTYFERNWCFATKFGNCTNTHDLCST